MRKYVGQRIKALREAQDMSLEQVARLAGIDPVRLAAYEDGSAVPAIGAVIQLSRVLGSKTEGLLHGGGTVSEHLTVCRAGDGLSGDQGDTEQNYTYTSLTRPGTANHMMEPFVISFDPATPKPAPIAHDGQEFCYVLEGLVEFTHDGRSFILEPGDSVYHDATHPHSFHGLGDKVSKMLAVVSS
jgi:transcriptional regulator with XRE-family HTH domain